MQGHAQTPAFELIEACFAETRRARQQARAIRRKTSSRSLPKGRLSGTSPSTTRDVLKEDTRSEEDLTSGIQPDAPPPGEYEVQPQRRPSGPSLSSVVSAGRRDGLVSVAPQIEPGKSGVEILLKQFANQVARWRQTDRRNPSPVEFAAQLKAKYLDQELRNLPVSKMSHIARKAITLEVAKIAKLPAPRPDDSSKGVSSPTKKNSAEPTLQPDAHAQKTGVVGQLDETDCAPQLQQQLANFNGLKFTELLAMCETQQTTLQHMMKS